MPQTCSKMVGPSPVRCSTNRMARPLRLAEQLLEPPLALDQRQVAQVLAVVLDQIKGVQHRLMTPTFASERVEVGCSVLVGDHGFAVNQERCGLDAAGSVNDGREKRSAQS
jgi:hypothetical protein